MTQNATEPVMIALDVSLAVGSAHCDSSGSRASGRLADRADAAMNGDREAVRALLKKGADVNAAQGDGMTALHWAAIKGDAELAQMLIYAGANVRATTRIGAYTPLYLAAKGGYAAVVAALLAGGADAKAVTANGTTPLMIAAAAGDTDVDHVAARERRRRSTRKDGAKGETPLMFAAGFNRADAVKLLLARGADHKVTTKVVDLFALTAPEEEATAARRRRQRRAPARAAARPADVRRRRPRALSLQRADQLAGRPDRRCSSPRARATSTRRRRCSTAAPTSTS